MRRNYTTIGYKDLISLVDRQHAFLIDRKEQMIRRGITNTANVNHEIECAKVLGKMLKAHRKDPQLNLNQLFDQVKN